MRILICPTAFKGSLSATEVTAALARGAREECPDAELLRLPLSDGGPGLLESLTAAVPGSRVRECRVRDPLGREVTARVLLLGGPGEEAGAGADGTGSRARPGGSGRDDAVGRTVEVVVESADACGLHHLGRRERDPLETDTRGVGDLIRAALGLKADRLYVGLGGSATCDGGTGMAAVLGWRFLDASERELPPGGGSLRRLALVQGPGAPDAGRETARGEPAGREPVANGLPPGRGRVHALTDVSNPLLGPRGAARVFAPQKGADAAGVERLEEGLRRLVARVPGDAPRIAGTPGAGAAGGLGFGLAAFAGADLLPGTEWVLDRVGFHDLLDRVDLVLTGEGAFDRTSDMGKVTGRVVRLARAAGVAAALVCGRVQGSPPEGISAYHGEEGDDLLAPPEVARLARRAVADLG